MSQVYITDHALIRYIERRHGIDLQIIREELADEVRSAIKARASSFFDGQVTYMFSGETVITVMPGRVTGRAPLRSPVRHLMEA